MRIERYSVRRTESGSWERYLQTVYEVELSGNALQVDGKQMPIEYKSSWACKGLKTRIYSCYDPKEFLRQFITDDELTFDCWKYNILDHVRKYGKAV